MASRVLQPLNRAVARLQFPLTVAVIVTQTLGAYWFGSGWDFSWFREATLTGHHPGVWLPVYAYWVLKPIMWLPFRLSLAVMVFVSSSLIAYSGYVLCGNPLPALLTSAGFLAAETGQIDGFIALGLAWGALACEKRKPFLLGIALLLMSFKPQIALVAAAWMIWHLRDWRVWVIPGGVFLLSLITNGLWPLALVRSLPNMAAEAHNISPWIVTGPFLLPLVVLPFLLARQNPRQAVPLSVAVSALALPYYNLYSLHMLFAAGAPAWLVPLTYAPFLPWLAAWGRWQVGCLAVIPAVTLIVVGRRSFQRQMCCAE